MLLFFLLSSTPYHIFIFLYLWHCAIVEIRCNLSCNYVIYLPIWLMAFTVSFNWFCISYFHKLVIALKGLDSDWGFFLRIKIFNMCGCGPPILCCKTRIMLTLTLVVVQRGSDGDSLIFPWSSSPPAVCLMVLVSVLDHAPDWLLCGINIWS